LQFAQANPQSKNCKRAYLSANAFLPTQKQNLVGGKYGNVVARMKGQENPAGNNVSYVIGQIVVNLKHETFNKHISGLKVKCFEMPNATYTNRQTAQKPNKSIN